MVWFKIEICIFILLSCTFCFISDTELAMQPTVPLVQGTESHKVCQPLVVIQLTSWQSSSKRTMLILSLLLLIIFPEFFEPQWNEHIWKSDEDLRRALRLLLRSHRNRNWLIQWWAAEDPRKVLWKFRKKNSGAGALQKAISVSDTERDC
jgi:hypothetical protein